MSEDDFLIKDTSVPVQSPVQSYVEEKKPHAKLHFRFLSGSEKSSFDFRKAPESFNQLHSHIVRKAYNYVHNSIDGTPTDFANKFFRLQEYTSKPFPPDRTEWRPFISDIAKKLSKQLGLYKNNTIRSGFIEEIMDSYGITFFVVPEKQEYKALDGFATCFMGIPILAIVQKANYRRMFFTLAHELYHLLFQEGEDLADVFAGSFLVPDKDKAEAIIAKAEEIPKAEQAKDTFELALPRLLDEFYFASIECLANTSERYKLIEKETKQKWLSGKQQSKELAKKKEQIYQQASPFNYDWRPKIEIIE